MAVTEEILINNMIQIVREDSTANLYYLYSDLLELLRIIKVRGIGFLKDGIYKFESNLSKYYAYNLDTGKIEILEPYNKITSKIFLILENLSYLKNRLKL